MSRTQVKYKRLCEVVKRYLPNISPEDCDRLIIKAIEKSLAQ